MGLRGKEIALIPQLIGYLDPLMQVGKQVQRVAQLSGLSPQGSPTNRRSHLRSLRTFSYRQAILSVSNFWRHGAAYSGVYGRGKSSYSGDYEPTPGLHPDAVRETLNHLRELADEGKGVILITHDIEATLQIADRVAVFYAGTTVEIAAATDFYYLNLNSAGEKPC